MDALQNLFNRRSVRDFTAQPIEEEKLHRILEAGMSGPCCVNARDWSFIVVTDREKLLEMAEANGRPAQPLKKAAAAVGEKDVEMLKQKDLLPLTGYVHGGCSPIGMKKQFPTVVHNSAENYATIIYSAGKVGYQVETSLAGLRKVIGCATADIIMP